MIRYISRFLKAKLFKILELAYYRQMKAVFSKNYFKMPEKYGGIILVTDICQF